MSRRREERLRPRAVRRVTGAAAQPTQRNRLWQSRQCAWAAKKEPERAIADYDEAIRLDPMYTAAFTSRGREQQTLGRTEGAIADYRAALRLPVNNQNGQWAHDTARARLKELGVEP